MVGSSSPASPRVGRLLSSPAIDRPALSAADRGPYFWLVGAMHDVQRGDDAEVERRPADRLTGKDKPGRFVSLTHEGRYTRALEQSGVKEMDHPATVRNIDPALDQLRVGLAVAVSDDPISQTVLTDQAGVQAPICVIMSMKADIRIFRRIIIGEEASAAAEKHPRAGWIAIAGHGGTQAMLA